LSIKSARRDDSSREIAVQTDVSRRTMQKPRNIHFGCGKHFSLRSRTFTGSFFFAARMSYPSVPQNSFFEKTVTTHPTPKNRRNSQTNVVFSRPIYYHHHGNNSGYP